MRFGATQFWWNDGECEKFIGVLA